MTRPSFLEEPFTKGHDALSMQRQLYERIRLAILEGFLLPGSRLPGTRALAESMSISRNTVTAAYDLLAAEGYVQSDRQGTRIAALFTPTQHAVATKQSPLNTISSCGANIAPKTSGASSAAEFRPGVPAISSFPLNAWRHAVNKAIRMADRSALSYGDPLGELVLRASIARHIRMARGVRCEADQLVITEGAQEALSLCVRLLTKAGDIGWVEDPGYRGAKAAMQSGSLRIRPMRVDSDGLGTTEDKWQTEPPRLIYTTPSHQYPMGSVLTVARRLDLIEKAQKFGAWIIEDDYDSEFRHAGEPIGAMQGLVKDAPVLYVGTFSKTMFPSLRLGFLVLPERLMIRTRGALQDMLRGGHRHEQLALADFIETGQFGRHVNRMRRLYRARQEKLRIALMRHLPALNIHGGHGGLHLTIQLPLNCSDLTIAEAAWKAGIAVLPLSGFVLKPAPHDNGLVLGYGNTPSERYDDLIHSLAKLICSNA